MSGPNRESERQRAGRLLFERLQEFERDGRPYHLVGHSHGGSVIWHALKYSAAHNQRLKGLKSWTTVSTPFLDLGPDGSAWRRIAAAVAAAAALYWMGIWELVPKIIAAIRQSGLAGLMTSIPLIEDLPDIRTALGDLYFFGLVAFFGSIAVLFAALLMAPFGDLARFLVAGPKRRHSDSRAAEWYEPLWLGLAHPQDEAIAGLKATLIRAPDLVIRKKRGLFGLVVDFVKPTRAIDQFAWMTLIRKAQGCDIRRSVVRRVAAAPEPFKNDVAPLAPAVIAEIEARADQVASQVLARFRDRLQTLSDQADLAALSGVLAGTYDDDSLIHTTMFENEGVRGAIVGWISAPRAASAREPVRNVARFAEPTVALSTAKAAAAVGFVAVVTIIALQGYQIYYAESRLAAAERIIARFDEPAFTLLRGAIAGEALLRAVRLGAPSEKASAAARKLSGGSESLESLIAASTKDPDEYLRQVLSGKIRLSEHHRARTLRRQVAALADFRRAPTSAKSASAVAPLFAAKEMRDAAIAHIEAVLSRLRYPDKPYDLFIPIAVGLGEQARAVSWTAEYFRNNPGCKDWDIIVTEAARVITDTSGIRALEMVIRECDSEDRRRLMRQLAVGYLRSCDLAKPLLDQASVNRVPDGRTKLFRQVQPLVLECLVRDGRGDDAIRLSRYARAAARQGEWDDTGYYWDMSQALQAGKPTAEAEKAALASQASEWSKLALDQIESYGRRATAMTFENDVEMLGMVQKLGSDRHQAFLTEMTSRQLYAYKGEIGAATLKNDTRLLDILREIDLRRHQAFLADLGTVGEAFGGSRDFPDDRTHLRQIHAAIFEQSRKAPCIISDETTIAIGTLMNIMRRKESQDRLPLVASLLSMADRCAFVVSEGLYQDIFAIMSAHDNYEERVAGLAQLAAFRPTLRLSMASADAIGLPSQILAAYVAAVDRHRPSARGAPGGAVGPKATLASN